MFEVVHLVYFDMDALASSSEDELVDAKRCKYLSVTVLSKPEEYDTRAESRMSASDFVNRLESGAGDVRKVVRNRNEPMDRTVRRGYQYDHGADTSCRHRQ